jgi:hypothetical protein
MADDGNLVGSNETEALVTVGITERHYSVNTCGCSG